jgi:hypothetical protein
LKCDWLLFLTTLPLRERVVRNRSQSGRMEESEVERVLLMNMKMIGRIYGTYGSAIGV